MTEEEIRDIKRRAGLLTEEYDHRQAMAALEQISDGMVALEDEIRSIEGPGLSRVHGLLHDLEAASTTINRIRQAFIKMPR